MSPLRTPLKLMVDEVAIEQPCTKYMHWILPFYPPSTTLLPWQPFFFLGFSAYLPCLFLTWKHDGNFLSYFNNTFINFMGSPPGRRSALFECNSLVFNWNLTLFPAMAAMAVLYIYIYSCMFPVVVKGLIDLQIKIDFPS